MSKRIDYSTQLLDLAGDFAAGLRLTDASPKCIPDNLKNKLEGLKKATPIFMSLDSIEMIVVAVLLQKTCTSKSPGGRDIGVLDLLNSVFSQQTPLSVGLRVVQSLCDRDVVYARKYQGRPVSTAFATFGAGATSDLFFDTVAISERTAAWVVGDDLMLGFFGEAPYGTNTEFLNDWSQAINHVQVSDFDFYCDHPFWNFLFGSEGARRELDRISHRLAITPIKIPFVDLVGQYELSLPEQLILMYDLHRGHDNHSWSALNENIFCEPNDSLWFVKRPPLTESSRLVRSGLFVRRGTGDGNATGEYHLSEEVRELIISGADENGKKPLV